MAYDLATVTNSGNQLLASVVSERSSLVIDKIEVSGTKLASSIDLKSMTSISSVVKTLSANGYQKKDNSFIISTVLDNSSVDADYQAWVFGIWAHKSDGGSPVLMSVITSTNSPDTIVKGSGTPVDYNYKFITTFSDTDSLTIQMSSDTYATNDTVLHNSGDETATGTKTFQEIKISNSKFPSLVQTDGQYITLNNGATELVPADDSKVVHKADTSNWQKQAMFNPGDYKIDSTSPTTDFATLLKSKYNKPGVVYIRENNGPSYITQFIDAVVICEGGSYWYAYGIGTNGNFAHRQIIPSSDTGWVINADDSQVVHSKDMRKPANDVAGIEEVNVKQDKIGYTPADDSKVIHHTIPKSVRDMNDEISDGLFYDTSLETLHSPFSSSSFYYQVFAGASGNIRQVAYANLDAFNPATRSSSNNGSTWTNWNFETIVDDDGLMTYGSSNWQIKVTNDSKVAHLSGKNNFDTVPTVNNNPLLLASSLPSDLARTGSNQEFTGKNTFDTAPIDKTTGHPYITKDSVPSITKDGVPNIPSDVARTGQTNTFTVAQTFSIAPTIKDASTDKGDNQAATMADLKSVEKSAWRELDFSGTSGVYKGKMNIKIDDTNKTIYLEGAMYFPSGTNAPQGTALIDLSHVVNHITSAHGCLFFLTGVNENANLAGSWGYSASTLGFSNSSITINSNVDYAYGKANYILPYPNPGKSAIYVTYDSLK